MKLLTIETTPAAAQYTANQINLPRLTMPIINLQARQPTTNAEMKPANIGTTPIDAKATSPSRMLRNISPKIGANTIRNENCAIDSFLLPSRRPVAMVVPERERPGIAAMA